MLTIREGLSRRDVLRVGALAFAGLSLADVLRLRAATPQATGRGKSVIMIWLRGGASHIDSYDMKPDAPTEIRVYRLGYYAGNGARLQATIPSSAVLRQNQPSPLSNAATGLIDCGNWAVSASWAVPASAVSGIYLARVTRTDNGGASLIPFIVRDDDGRSFRRAARDDGIGHKGE